MTMPRKDFKAVEVELLLASVGGYTVGVDPAGILEIVSAQDVESATAPCDVVMDTGLLLHQTGGYRRWALIVRHGEQRVGLLVSDIIGQKKVDVSRLRQLPPLVRDTIGTATVQGLLLLPDSIRTGGDPLGLVLDLQGCCQEGLRQSGPLGE
jgi:hypothetical protein